MIQTINGPVDPQELGFTLIHEHILWQFEDSRRKESIDFAVGLLQKALQTGLKSFVDLTPFRRIDWLMEIAGRVDGNIIASTGYYREPKVPQPLHDVSEDSMVEKMVNELTVGIDSTPVKAGIIKVAADHPVLTPWEEQAFRAAARTSQRTGVRIATHAVAGARSQAEVLAHAGADLNRVFFSHVDTEAGFEGRTPKEQASYLEEIARMGGWLLLNNFGCLFYTSWENEVYLMKHLCDAGFQDKVLISIDVNWTWNQAGKIVFEAEADHPEAGKRDYAFMMEDTVPALLQSGFSERDIEIFLNDNPRKFFA